MRFERATAHPNSKKIWAADDPNGLANLSTLNANKTEHLVIQSGIKKYTEKEPKMFQIGPFLASLDFSNFIKDHLLLISLK